jgi:NAD(P)-dependent dehydrogenase (short-subunit alcohol dehydrogenase family)
MQTVLITGAAGGIGRATVRAFAAAGWQVAGTDLATEHVEGTQWYFSTDLADAGAAERIAAAVRQQTGRLDALVNNAAVQVLQPAVQAKAADWDSTMAVNARAPLLLSTACFPLLATSRGSIVNVSSVHAVATAVQMATYAASKGALVALTRALAVEFAPAGVRVNAVLPGAIDTPMLRASVQRLRAGGEDPVAAIAFRTPLRRIGRPEDIAEAVLFLADGTRSAFITGQTLIVDGGVMSQLGTESSPIDRM